MGDHEPGGVLRDPHRVNHNTRKEGYNMMKKYRNTKTGVEISTPCDISGDNWEPVKGRKAKAAQTEAEKAPESEAEPEEAKQAPEPQESTTVIGPTPEETGAAKSNE